MVMIDGHVVLLHSVLWHNLLGIRNKLSGW